MIIQQRSTEGFAPVKTFGVNEIVDSSGSVERRTHRSVKFDRTSATATHNEYYAFGSNLLPVEIASQSPADSLDISEWPTVKRKDGVDSVVSASFENERAVSSTWDLDFTDRGGQVYDNKSDEIIPGTLLEYTYNIVKALADAMTGNAMWDSSGNRAQTNVIPHEFLTGHVWNGKWGPGTGAGTTPITGRRFMAITKRHLFACGHYQYYPGDILQWKDIDNNIIERTVLRVINVRDETAALGGTSFDMSITLLDADLPGSIAIPPVAGDWALGIISEDSDSIVACPQVAGITLLNNDGHMNPFLRGQNYDTTWSKSAVAVLDGISIDNSRALGNTGYSNTTDIAGDWSPAVVGNPFYHELRGGDSGSPSLIPYADGWAFCGYISGRMAEASLLDELIALIDSREGISTGYTVTVAPDPTL